MNPSYNLAEHGDLLEKEGADFVRRKFPFYERVWQVYIGNRGNATIAELPDYPWQSKRVSFAEYSYSTFESCFMIQGILESGIFTSEINSFGKYMELNKSFITFFAYLGRIRDTILKASNDLKYVDDTFRESMQQHFEARNVVIHGKKVPLLIGTDDFIKMPVLKTSYTKGKA